MKLNKTICFVFPMFLWACVPAGQPKSSKPSNTETNVATESFFIKTNDVDHSDIYNRILKNVAQLENWDYSEMPEVYLAANKITKKNSPTRSDLLLLDRQIKDHVKKAIIPIREKKIKKQFESFKGQMTLLQNANKKSVEEIPPLNVELK